MAKPTPRIDEVEARLMAMVGRLSPGDKLPTVRELQTEFGASLATLDRAFRRLVSRGVLERRHGSGLYVGGEADRRRIAMVVAPRLLRSIAPSPFWGLFIDLAERRAEEGRERFELHMARPDLTEPSHYSGGEFAPTLGRDVSAGRVHGVMAVGIPHVHSRWLESKGLPVVSYAGASNWMVSLDSPGIARAAVARLADRGCRRLGLLSLHDREIAAFTEACAEAGVSAVATESYVGFSPAEAGRRFATGYADAVDGVVSVDDVATQYFLLALRSRETRPAVASLEIHGSPVLDAWRGEFDALEVDPAEIVGRMTGALEALFAGERPSEGWTRHPGDPRLMHALIGAQASTNTRPGSMSTALSLTHA